MKTLTVCLFITFFVSGRLSLSAQESKLLLDKPGTFKMVYYGVFNHDDCGFTKAETTANYQKLVALTDVFRRNPVLRSPKGFDCIAMKTSWNCDPKNSYGIPSEIWIQFCSWSLDEGKEVCWTDEPPEWAFEVNRLRTFGAAGFHVTSNQPTASKQGFNMEQWEKAADKVNELFFMPGAKEILGSGLDRYNGDFIIVYNPDRPAYWLHVSIRETFGLLFDYWRQDPNQTSSEMILKMLEKEYARFSEPERDGYAYYGDPGSISRIGSDSRQLPVMRINPAYWNKSLPRSAIQILSFYCQADKNIIKNEMEERLKDNSGYYHLSRFAEALDITIFSGIIDK